MDANEVIMIAAGHTKANALKQCIEGSISSCSHAPLFKTVKSYCNQMKLQQRTIKTMKYYKTLQKSINIMGEPIIDYISKLVDCNDKILITSPHPDDDVMNGRNNAVVT